MISYESDIKDMLIGVDNETKVKLLEISSLFHYRNAIKHKDGSMGEIKITPKELIDCLAYVSKGQI